MGVLCQNVSAVSLAARLCLALHARTAVCLPAVGFVAFPTLHWIIGEENNPKAAPLTQTTCFGKVRVIVSVARRETSPVDWQNDAGPGSRPVVTPAPDGVADGLDHRGGSGPEKGH